MISLGQLQELAALLAGSEPVTIVAGAACSRLMPTDLPDAATWKHLLLDSLVARADCGLGPDAAERLARAGGIQLEAIFAAIGRQFPGLSERLIGLTEPVSTTGQGHPNGLHRLLAARAIRVPGSAILTTNFDRCFERAIHALGAPASRWLAGQAVQLPAIVFKLHGSTEDPATLRHTFESVGRAFPDRVRALLRPVSSQKLIVLGYFGADPDVLELLGTGDTAWWLVRGREEDNPRHGARRLGRLRDVRVVPGDFADLLHLLGQVPIPMGDGRRLASSTAEAIHSSLDPASAHGALTELSFRAMTADAAMGDLDEHLFRRMEQRSSELPPDEVWRCRGERARYRGGVVGPAVRSAWCFLRAAAKSAGPTRVDYLSDALDSLEMLAWISTDRVDANTDDKVSAFSPVGGLREPL